MKKNKLFLLVLLAFFTVLNSCDKCKDGIPPQIKYVGISSSEFDWIASSQKNSNWCWAASIQMILNYNRIAITQEQIVYRSYGVDPFGNLPNWTGSYELITRNLNNWNIDNNGIKYQVQAVFNLGPPQPQYLIQELLEKHPILIGYPSSLTSGHAVVITGCSYIDSETGPIIQSIIVRDPYPTDVNIYNKGRIEYNGYFGNNITTHWIVRVKA